MATATIERPWARWYGLQRWRNRSTLQLKLFPLCKLCLEKNIVTAANVADHVIPHKGNEQLFWRGALQPLCYMHHNSTKQLEEHGIIKDYINDIGVDGFPIDPKHPVYGAPQKK
jgi:5-methylcytosine-specific restriction protein A